MSARIKLSRENAELPPLPSKSPDWDAIDAYAEVAAERERILLARVAELEADAERYRWLRDNAGVGQGEHVHEQMAYQFEVLTGVSHVSHIYHYAELPSIDAAIDAARNAK